MREVSTIFEKASEKFFEDWDDDFMPDFYRGFHSAFYRILFQLNRYVNLQEELKKLNENFELADAIVIARRILDEPDSSVSLMYKDYYLKISVACTTTPDNLKAPMLLNSFKFTLSATEFSRREMFFKAILNGSISSYSGNRINKDSIEINSKI